MTRNYTETRRYLQQVENKMKIIRCILEAEGEARTNGGGTLDLQKKRHMESVEYSRLFREVEKKINMIGDEKLRIILTRRYLRFQDRNQIRNSMGWSEMYMHNLTERALMNMEIILLQDGILSFIDGTKDMVEDYEDGMKRGYSKGRAQGYAAGYDVGYSTGYKRGATGQPYDEDEDHANIYHDDVYDDIPCEEL